MISARRWKVLRAMQAGIPLCRGSAGQILLGDEEIAETLIELLLEPPALIRRLGDGFELTARGKKARYKGSEPRKTPRPTPVAIYLGKGEVSKRRTRVLDEIAAPYGGRSKMLQMLADGKLKIVPVDQDLRS